MAVIKMVSQRESLEAAIGQLVFLVEDTGPQTHVVLKRLLAGDRPPAKQTLEEINSAAEHIDDLILKAHDSLAHGAAGVESLLHAVRCRLWAWMRSFQLPPPVDYESIAAKGLRILLSSERLLKYVIDELRGELATLTPHDQSESAASIKKPRGGRPPKKRKSEIHDEIRRSRLWLAPGGDATWAVAVAHYNTIYSTNFTVGQVRLWGKRARRQARVKSGI
jgi:hypothetical protein